MIHADGYWDSGDVNDVDDQQQRRCQSHRLHPHLKTPSKRIAHRFLSIINSVAISWIGRLAVH